MDRVDKPQNYKNLYGILQLLQGSHLNNFPLKTLKLGWVAFNSVTFQLKCLDSQSNQYKKLAPVHSRFCNGIWTDCLSHKFFMDIASVISFFSGYGPEEEAEEGGVDDNDPRNCHIFHKGNSK